MRILVAPDKFKGSLTAEAAGRAMAAGLRRVAPDVDVDLAPMADGGEGTVEAIVAATGGQTRTVCVTGPLGVPVDAKFGIFEAPDSTPTAIVEMSAASGISLVAGANEPLKATTFGTGELVKAALDAGCKRLIIGLGGSATTDGGAGMARALGARFLDEAGRDLGPGGGALLFLRHLDIRGLDARLKRCEISVACDVDNPLFGPGGAAQVYGPQKGATPEQITQLDEGLRHLAAVIRRELGTDVADIPGAGAAGGLGAGLVAFTGARLKSGFLLVSEAVGLHERLEAADMVITGEGRVDGQTVRGKVPIGLAGLAKKRNLPVVVVAGSLGAGYEELLDYGITIIEPLAGDDVPLEARMDCAAELVSDAAERAMLRLMPGVSK